MGTGWNYLLEFDGNAHALLASLRQQVFESGKYQFPIIDLTFLDELELFTVPPEERELLVEECSLQSLMKIAEQVGLDGVQPWLWARVKDRRVKTMDELRALQCLSESGTHSPLDIFGVSDVPRDFHLFPLTPGQIMSAFGMDRIEVEDMYPLRFFVAEQLPDAYESWQAVYLPVFTDDVVTHAYVEGASGD